MRLAILCLLSVLLPSVANAEARIALLIGNQRYSAKVGPLNNPHSDVLLVGAALKAVGFTVTEVKDADYCSTDAAIKRHIAAVRREGQGALSFVYYSGHGAADPDTKINYLMVPSLLWWKLSDSALRQYPTYRVMRRGQAAERALCPACAIHRPCVV